MLENLNADYMGDMTERFICFKAESPYEDFREKMLIHNNIGGHLNLNIISEGVDKIYRYDISGRKSLREVLKDQHLNDAFLIHFLRELERIFRRGKSYMLDEDDYILHPDGVFLDSEGQLWVCYLPGYGKTILEQLCVLLGYMMDCVDVNDKQSVYAVYSAIVTVREGNCTFGSLIEALEKGIATQNDIERELLSESQEPDKEENMSVDKEKKENYWMGKVFISNGIKRRIGYLMVMLVFMAIVIYFIRM